MKSNMLKDLLAEMKNNPQPISRQPERDLSYYLGVYAANEIYDKYLPTLSVSPLKSNVVIDVSEEDNEKYLEINMELLAERNKNSWQHSSIESDEFKKYREFNHLLAAKYLPHRLECFVMGMPPNVNIEEYKDGVIGGLWNTDLCEYKLGPDDIEISYEHYMTVIVLNLDIK